MNLKKIDITPFAEGIIRVASTTDLETEKTRFFGSMEILARHHQVEQKGEGSVTPKLAQHPVEAMLMAGVQENKNAGKLVEVPITLFFNKAAKAISVRYQAFDTDGRPVCMGDGENAQRLSKADDNTVLTTKTPCTGPESCDFACNGGVTCRRQVNMPVQIKGQGNPFSVFEVRTSSYHSYKALRAQLALIEVRFGGLRNVPLKLQLWQASNQASEYECFDLFKLALDGESEAKVMEQVKKARSDEADIGLGCNVDETFDHLKTDDLFANGDLEFAAVSDFYKPTPSSQASARRSGGISVAAQAMKQSTQGGGAMAANLISSAVSAVARTRTSEQVAPEA